MEQDQMVEQEPLLPEITTIEELLDRVHGQIMRECPKTKNPHRAVRIYVAQWIYARKRELTRDMAHEEAMGRVKEYYFSSMSRSSS